MKKKKLSTTVCLLYVIRSTFYQLRLVEFKLVEQTCHITKVLPFQESQKKFTGIILSTYAQSIKRKLFERCPFCRKKENKWNKKKNEMRLKKSKSFKNQIMLK